MKTTAQKTNRSPAKKRVILLFICSMILLILCTGALFIYLLRQTSGMLREFNALGFEKTIQGRLLTITNPVTEPVLFMASDFRLTAGCSTNIAILAETAEIDGEVSGKLYFRGRALTISSNGIICNGLNIEAQTLRNDGILDGDIEGGFETTGESR